MMTDLLHNQRTNTPPAAKPGAYLPLVLLTARAITLPATIQRVHRLPPIGRAYRIDVGISFNLPAGRQVTVTDGRPINGRCSIAVDPSAAVGAWAAIAVDAHVIERPASPNTILAPTDPVCDLLDIRANHTGRYKRSRCAPNWTGVCICSHGRQRENGGRTRQQNF